jgi:quercetin dioxygenase-like cupin family protein
MPIDIRHFGVGHRRPDGPPGTTGIEGQVIESGPGGVLSELAFGRQARMSPHSNPNWTYLVVIEGGGWVGVGDERTRVLAGEAVAWPPDVPHAAWTDGAPMRAIVVEFAGPLLALPGVVDVVVAEVVVAATPSAVRPVARGDGDLVSSGPERRVLGVAADADEGEPL